ncbi:MAG: glucose-1-phosphate adenylyltransferase [Planctomycetes bacterium]|nr:glucose-1-phosphate adenylyltransferase [Planctomycetota bacterium]
MNQVVTAILGGGQGQRLWPLTRDRAKPAVPLGGKFRLIDVPISNSLHAGFDRIFVMTQFQSASLHRHIAQTYRFDSFRGGFVNILAAEQREGNRDWYQGTADAVRQNLEYIDEHGARDVVVLSGDQLYLMRLKEFVGLHRTRRADFTVAVTPVARAQAPGLGLLRVDGTGRIVEFVEKPKDPAVLDRFALDAATLERLGFEAPEGSFLASMGIYVFRREVMRSLLLASDAQDFGKEILPRAIVGHRAFAYNHTGYWRDIGTIPAFHEASLDLTLPLPPLNLYSPDFPIYTHPRFLPGAKVNRCRVEQSILTEGCIISDSSITRSIVGIRGIVREGSTVENTIVMGATRFEPTGGTRTPLGIGRDVRIRNAIVDLDARIGDGARLVNEGGVLEADGDNWCIRGGIIVVPRSATIPPGTVI